MDDLFVFKSKFLLGGKKLLVSLINLPFEYNGVFNGQFLVDFL